MFQDFGGPTPELTIINPPTEPKDGEIVGFRLRDFPDDEDFIKRIEAYEECLGYIVLSCVLTHWKAI